MNDTCKEFAQIIRRDYPLSIGLIILTIIAKESKEVLQPFLESELITITQIIVMGIVVFTVLRYSRSFKSHLKKEIKQINRLAKILFAMQFIFMLLGTAYINTISINIFLLNLFPIAYGNENQIRDSWISLQDLLSFTLYPFLAWINFHIFRQKYLDMELEETRFNRIICFLRKYWIWSSLSILIILNLGLIISGFEFRLM